MTKHGPYCFVRSFCLRANLEAILQIVVSAHNTFGYWGTFDSAIVAAARRRRARRAAGGGQRPLASVNTTMLIGRERNCHWNRATCKHVPKPFRIASDVRSSPGKRHCCTPDQLPLFFCNLPTIFSATSQQTADTFQLYYFPPISLPSAHLRPRK
jgi:hypothetical protein